MPELPEVQTTADSLNRILTGLKIVDVWSGYDSPYYKGKKQIKDRRYFSFFKKSVVGKKFERIERQGKNVLLHISDGKTVVVHMKMTGHLLFGKYQKAGASQKFKVQSSKEDQEKWSGEKWIPDEPKNSALWDPFNRHIRLVFSLSNGKSLVLSDARKFAKVFVYDSNKIENHPELSHLGPNPLSKDFGYEEFKERVLSRKSGKIKQVLMDQRVVAGIGNIYSDELLWEAGVHPASSIGKIPEAKYKEIFRAMKNVLKKGIKFKGDSTSDYRKPDGKRGGFQKMHNVYRRKGQDCLRADGGIIEREVFGGRSAHFCPKHQKKY